MLNMENVLFYPPWLRGALMSSGIPRLGKMSLSFFTSRYGSFISGKNNDNRYLESVLVFGCVDNKPNSSSWRMSHFTQQGLPPENYS